MLGHRLTAENRIEWQRQGLQSRSTECKCTETDEREVFQHWEAGKIRIIWAVGGVNFLSMRAECSCQVAKIAYALVTCL